MNYIHADENAIYHECGYSNDNSIYLSLGSDRFLLTDGRYKVDANESLQGTNAKVIIARDLAKSVAKLINKSHIKKVYFDPKEWNFYNILRIQNKTNIAWKEKLNLSHKKRIIKSEAEIELLSKAVRLGAKAFDRFANMIYSNGIGKSEKELNFLASSSMSNFGEMYLSFDPIVAIGSNAAKPHAIPTDRSLKDGDLLLFDAGLKYERYCSDRTRTVEISSNFNFSTKQSYGSKKIQKAYDTVLKAHDVAISKARSGMRANEIDSLARDVIEKAGFGKYFVHSTGHGVGLDIHEMPYISSHSRTKIDDGMVYTIEPGIYIPDEFGIRIEDMIVMSDGKADIL